MFGSDIVGRSISMNLSPICSSKCVCLSTRARAGYPDVSTHTQMHKLQKHNVPFTLRLTTQFLRYPAGQNESSRPNTLNAHSILEDTLSFMSTHHKDLTDVPCSFSYWLCPSPNMKRLHILPHGCTHTHMHNTDRINSITWADWLKIHNLPFSQRDALSLIETRPKYSPLRFTGFCCTWYTAAPPLDHTSPSSQ